MAKAGIICQACGIEAPTRYVAFYQNVGALVVRFGRSAKGEMCKRCINRYFWKMTGTTAAVGWAGSISFFLAPAFVLNNLIRYSGTLRMPKVPPGAKPPTVDNEAITLLWPHIDKIVRRLQSGEDLIEVAKDVAPAIGVTPGQVVIYIASLSRQQQAQVVANVSTGGFPVMPLSAAPPPPLPALPLH